MKKLGISLIVFIMLLTGCYESEKIQSDTTGNEVSYVSEEKEAAYESTSGTVALEEDMESSSEKLIYRANLCIETLNYQETIKEIRNHIKKFEGMVEYENEYSDNYDWYKENAEDVMHAQLTIRIPTKHYDEFLNQVEGSAKVISKNTSIENITKEYNDNSVRIEAFEVQQKRLLEMMSKAETIEEMIAVETRLTEVQTELNILKSYQASMDTDIEYSQITLSIDEVKKYTESTSSFLLRIKERFIEGLEGFVEFIVNVILVVVYLSPFILVIGCVLYILNKKNKLPQFIKKKKDIAYNNDEEGKE